MSDAGKPANRPEALLERVHKTYHMGTQEVHALRGVSLAFRKGSFWAILGQSGSGKSTLLNILGCLDRPSKGRYLLRDQDTAGMDDDALSDLRLSTLGFIFQSFNLIPQLTVEQNIHLPLYYQGWDQAASAQRAQELAEMVGLETRTEHRPSELSGGQQQRVAIARALANNPAVLLADEPTGNLDSQTGIEIMDLLARLNGEGMTILMVTHEPSIAEYASSRLYMRDGEIERMEGEV